PTISLLAVGDIMLSRTVATKIKQNGPDYPFVEFKSILNSVDLVFANLETPLTPGRLIRPQEMLFRSDPTLVKTLQKYNFSVLSLANNHTPNFGTLGLNNTFKYLDQAKIVYVGAGHNLTEANQPKYVSRQGIKLAFLAYNDADVVPNSYFASSNHSGTNPMNLDNLKLAIRQAKQQADLVIVSMHSGYEYQPHPNQHQINFAQTAIDNGAELVIGHHPHVVQDIKKYKGKYIFYSLGNFIFDQMWSLKTRQGLAVKIILNKNGLVKFKKIPFLINDYCQPKPVNQKLTPATQTPLLQ
ncbi:CapA family protein, partial [Candidatus Shapirobacteria bacterium]